MSTLKDGLEKKGRTRRPLSADDIRRGFEEVREGSRLKEWKQWLERIPDELKGAACVAHALGGVLDAEAGVLRLDDGDCYVEIGLESPRQPRATGTTTRTQTKGD